MGTMFATLATRDIDLQMDDKPTFDPQAGFTFKRKPRVMIAKDEEMISSRIEPQYRDYCAHLLIKFRECRYKNVPFAYRCAHEKHDYANCLHQDYVLRMKEFERERRLRIREQRIAGQVC